ncbi:MAG: hypothetical protein AB1644_06885 [Candidatus Zixiibacteriota bacterium]
MSRHKLLRQVLCLCLLCIPFLAIQSQTAARSAEQVCGDVDASGAIDVGDIAYLVDFLCFNAAAPPYPQFATCDGNREIDISDLAWIIDYLFFSGPAPLCLEGSHTDVTGPCLSHLVNKAMSGAATTAGQSGCLNRVQSEEQAGEMHAELVNGKLHVYHTNAYYQCCLGYSVTYEQTGRFITAVESDTGELCDCYCYFDLESVWEGLYPYGDEYWIVVLIGIEGDTVGTDTIPVNGTMVLETVGHDLHVHHLNAPLNCCPAFYVDYTIVGNQITAVENDSLNACLCLCFYNLESVLYELSPGEYVVTLIGGTTTPFAGDTIGVDTAVIAP